MRKYLSQLYEDAGGLSGKELADKAYNNEVLESNTQRKLHLFEHFKYAECELAKIGATRLLLWKEYLLKHPDGYGYSQYCDQLKQYLKHKDVFMHLEYNPADMMRIDFAGKKQYYVDISTGESMECEVFVAILPFSGLIFCHDCLQSDGLFKRFVLQEKTKKTLSTLRYRTFAIGAYFEKLNGKLVLKIALSKKRRQ